MSDNLQEQKIYFFTDNYLDNQRYCDFIQLYKIATFLIRAVQEELVAKIYRAGTSSCCLSLFVESFVLARIYK